MEDGRVGDGVLDMATLEATILEFETSRSRETYEAYI